MFKDKLISILILLIFLISPKVFATSPTVAASNLSFTNVLGDRMTLNWTNGNGAERIVIFRQGSTVTSVPTNGTDYPRYSSLSAQERVVYKGTGNSFTFENDGVNPTLTSNTTYFFAIYEYNGSGTGTEFLTSSFLSGSASTANMASEPTVNSSSASIQWRYEEILSGGTTRQKMGIGWTSGNGSSRLVIFKQGSAVDASVFPNDGVNVNQWQNLGNGNIVCYKGSGNYIEFKSDGNGTLIPNATYYFAIIEFNGTGTTANYKIGTYTSFNGTTLATRPITAPTNLTFTNVGTSSMTLNWTNGNGTNRLVIARSASAVTATPTDGVNYSAGQAVSSGQYVVYSGTGSSFTCSNIGGSALTSGITYYFSIIEYSVGSSGTNNYLSSSPLSGNKTTASPASEPTTPASNLTFSSVHASSMTLNWTSGNGTKRLVIFKQGSPVTVTPTDGVSYSLYTSLASGQRVVYNGSGSSFTFSNDGISSLSPNTTYYFAIFEYNGSSTTTNYLTSSYLTGSQSTGATGTKIGAFMSDPIAVNLDVYPNPAQDFLNININSASGTTYNVAIFNSLGQTVKEFSINDNESSYIDINSLGRGAYTIRAISDDKVLLKNVILQ